jgi:hypothetical protein
MADEDRIAALVSLLVGGVQFADERLAPLREAMTPEELAVVGRRIGGAYVRSLPPLPTDSGAPDVTELDSAGVYVELVRRRVRGDDVRLVALGTVMSDDELARCREAIGALWLMAEPSGRPN